MTTVNGNFLKFPGVYLFQEIAHQVAAFKKTAPEKRVISLGIGDVTQPLAPAVIRALHSAVDEMGNAATFRGYGPEQGYAFLREAIAKNDYQDRGIKVDASEIFVSDGAKSDVGSIQELFSNDAVIAVTDPVYPVYVDSNVIAGRAGDYVNGKWSNIVYLPCTKANGFVPEFPKVRPDVIYLCYPNNPTGTVLTRDALKAWVDYARREGSVILYDSAYEAYITEPGVPHSIYEIEGAREVAIEFRSFSKTAGFTGLHCAYVVVPEELKISDGKGGQVALKPLWSRRNGTKYNGCPYIVQRAAEAVYSEEGKQEIRQTIGIYQNNAAVMHEGLTRMGLEVIGGKNAPYLWVATPEGTDSWGFFHKVLENAAVVCTPGVGFGAAGEGYVRMTAFGSPADTVEALERLAKI